MKNSQALIPVLVLALFGVGCGEYQKDPASGLDEMRAHARAQAQAGPDKPREITNTVVVEKPVLVVKEESTIDEKFIVITPDSEMTFNEGEESKFKIRASALLQDVQIKLVAQGLPKGATLTPSKDEKDIYILSWNPEVYTLDSNAMMKSFAVKLTAEVVSAKTPEDLQLLKGLVREKEISLFLFKNQKAPTDLKIVLPTEINEDSLTPFTITVKVPGIDGRSTQKPRLVISYDGASLTAGNSFLELDGSRHIIADLNKKDPEYLGDSNWKFSLIFDTKNISVQPQLSKDGKIISNADGTRVRLSVKAYNPSGLSTAEKVAQVKIKYTKGLVAPKFDLSGLAQQALEVQKGQKVSLKFVVSSADKTSVVRVESAKSNLAGNPQVSCGDSKEGTAKQDCTLTMNIACDAKAEALKGEIRMSAYSVSNGRNSEVTEYTLNVQPAAQEDTSLCSTEATK